MEKGDRFGWMLKTRPTPLQAAKFYESRAQGPTRRSKPLTRADIADISSSEYESSDSDSDAERAVGGPDRVNRVWIRFPEVREVRENVHGENITVDETEGVSNEEDEMAWTRGPTPPVHSDIIDISAKKLREIGENVYVESVTAGEIEETRVSNVEDEVPRARGPAPAYIIESSGGPSRRRLPASFTGKEKEKVVVEEEKGEKRGGLLDYIDDLKVIFGNAEESDEEEDFFDMIKRKGLIKFPKPRWW